jgi:hypothetical protein
MSKKLGFRETISLKWQVPYVFCIQKLYLDVTSVATAHKNVISQNDVQLIELKRRQYAGDLLSVEENKSLVWGVPRKKNKFGMQIPYFEIGGIKLESSTDTKGLFDKLWKRLRGVRYIQLTTSVGNTLNSLFKHLRPAQTEDLHVFDLNLDTTAMKFNFFGGVKDVF